MKKRFFIRLTVALFAIAVPVNGGEITAIDENGLLSDGSNPVAETTDTSAQRLNAGSYTITDPASAIDMTGGASTHHNLVMGDGTTLTLSADTTTALKVNDYTITGGDLTAYNGNSSHLTTSSGATHGLHAAGDFNHAGGNVTAIARTGDAYGNAIAVVGRYIQGGGALVAEGGAGSHSAGLRVGGDFVQNVGTAYIKAGIGSWTPGMWVASNATFNDKVFIQRGGAGSDGLALNAGSSDSHTLKFGSGSQLTFDLAGAGALPFIRAKEVQIESGATVNFLNTASIGSGTSQYDFIKANYGITGEFLFPNSSTLAMSIEKTAYGDSYTAYFNRTGTASDVIAAAPAVDSNASSLINGLSPFYGSAALSNIPLLSAELSAFDMLTDPGEIAAQAEKVVRMFTPVDAVSSASNLAASVNGMASNSMLRNVFSPAAGGGYNQAAVSASSTDALASYVSPSGVVRSVWLTPLAQWVRIRPSSSRFSKVNENIYGAGFGFGIRRDYSFAAGGSIHYLRSDMNSQTTDSDSDIFGFNLFGRKYFANKASFHPFVEGGAGYSFIDSTQIRKAVSAHSNPESHVLSGNMALGFDFLVGNTALTPKFGFDYSHVRTGSYRETGVAGLEIDPENFDSFRGVLGIGVKTQLNDCLYVTASAAYKREFADRAASASNCFTTSPDILFVTQGEKRSRSSGDFGAGLGWQPRANVLVGVNYDLTLAEKQRNHSVSVRFGLDF